MIVIKIIRVNNNNNIIFLIEFINFKNVFYLWKKITI